MAGGIKFLLSGAAVPLERCSLVRVEEMVFVAVINLKHYDAAAAIGVF